MSEKKVTSNQFYTLLYLSLLSSVLMYLSSSRIDIASTDAILRPLLFVPLSIGFIIPSFLVLKRYKTLQHNRQYIQKSILLKIISFIYAVVYFISILKATARFDLFVSTELFPNSDMTVFLAVMIICCAAVAFLGVGALSRAAVCFAFLVILSTVFVMISLWNDVDFLNFTPLFENGILKLGEESLLFTMQATELGTIIIFLPQIEGDIKGKFKWWAVFSGISFSAILFFVVGSLGEFADTQLFPTYASVTIASFGLLERIDALETAIWILCVITKIAFYFTVVIKCLKYSLSKVSAYIWGIISACATVIIIAFISINIERFYFLSSEVLTIVLFFVSVIILPTAIYFYIKRVKPCEKIQENI